MAKNVLNKIRNLNCYALTKIYFSFNFAIVVAPPGFYLGVVNKRLVNLHHAKEVWTMFSTYQATLPGYPHGARLCSRHKKYEWISSYFYKIGGIDEIYQFKRKSEN